MACEFLQDRVHGYLDGELDAVSSAEFEHHLSGCAECYSLLAAERAIRANMARADLYERAPDRLRASLASPRVGTAVVPRGPASREYWTWLAVAAMLLLAMTSALLGWNAIRWRESGASFARAAVDAHLRSLQQGHLTDVESTDQHTVKPWFDGRVDFAPKVADFKEDGFPLLGGRLDVLEGRTVAALVYGRRKHIINVFVAPQGSAGAQSGGGELRGYHWLAWQSGAFSCVAVTDASAGDLEQLRALLDRQ